MKGNKMIATLVVLAMVLSTMLVLFNNSKIEAKEAGMHYGEKIPGVDAFQGTLAPLKPTILNMTQPNLVVGSTVDLKFNGSVLGGMNYYLYKPQYYSRTSQTSYYVWVNWTQASTSAIDGNATTPEIDTIPLNVSGFWFIAPANLPNLNVQGVNMSNMSVYTPTRTGWRSITGWFWVNSSAWTVTLDKSSTYYDENTSVIVTVKNGSGEAFPGGTYGFIDMWKIENSHYNLIYHYHTDVSNPWTITASKMYDYTHLKGAGYYAFSAYRDVRPDSAAQGDMAELIYGGNGNTNGQMGWNLSFGNTSTVWTGRFTNSGNQTKIYDYTLGTLVRDGTGKTYARWKTTTYRYYNNATAGCGPFNPPEYWSDYTNLTISSGVPTLSIATANQTQYWSFDGTINVSIKRYDLANLTKSYKVFIFNESGGNVTNYFGVTSTNGAWGENCTRNRSGLIRIFTGYCVINCSTWGKNHTTTMYGKNGTWSIRFVKNSANASSGGNNTYEWNGTINFAVTQAPASQFKWISDDGGTSTPSKPNDGVIPSVPSKTGNGVTQALDIQFQIINRNHRYFGGLDSSLAQAKENITLSGDALYLSSSPMKLKNYPGSYEFVGGTTWHVWLTPTMNTNGGHITIGYTWKNYSSDSKVLQIGGSLTAANGSIVSVSPTEFFVGDNITFTVTVTDPATGNPINNAYVALLWLRDSDAAAGANGTGNMSGFLAFKDIKTSNGQYTLRLNTSQETNNQTAHGGPFTSKKAPRNLTVYVNAPNFGYGYALIKMKPQHNFKVTMEPSTVMAGKYLTHVWFNTTKVDSTGNKTGYPPHTGLKVRIYNSTGTDVTTTIGSISDATVLNSNDNLSITSGMWFNKPGVYTVYASNNTWDSQGHNATLTVQAVDVACDLSEFIWKVDENQTATFTVTYNGQLVNGTLRIDNMTSNTSYNGTWWLTNFTVATDHTTSGTDRNLTSKEVAVTNGIAVVHNITATHLPGTVAKKNVTFYFKPTVTGFNSAWAHTNGVVPVTIADVAVSPTAIPFNKGSQITITVTGRNTGLNRQWTSVTGAGITQQIGNTSSDGKVSFWVYPTSTGDISISIQNRTSDTKVRVTPWSLYIDAPLQANENEPFTITVRNGTASGDGLASVAVKFNGETKTTGSDGTVTFTAPSVSGDRTYTIYATAEGYAEDTETIQVINIPQLIIAISGEVKTSQAFTVVVADDTGGPVIGATVTFEGKTYTTGAGGTVTLTAPATEGSYPISATFGTFAAASSTVTVVKGAGIPGFELLTLVAAIGIAFLLLRRRRN